MAVKIIRCPSCGEEIEITDLYEGVEIDCKLCNAVMIYQEGRLLLLDTNEEFDIEELESYEEVEEEPEEDFGEEEYYYEDEY
jgi:DNA-directed RNA polymerase subunit RPC12/RpoP